MGYGGAGLAHDARDAAPDAAARTGDHFHPPIQARRIQAFFVLMLWLLGNDLRTNANGKSRISDHFEFRWAAG